MITAIRMFLANAIAKAVRHLNVFNWKYIVPKAVISQISNNEYETMVNEAKAESFNEIRELAENKRGMEK